MKVRVELIDNYMEAADLLPHGGGHLNESQHERVIKEADRCSR